ncbi:MAG: DUF6261 family protein [Chitinophagaceae bacterium]
MINSITLYSLRNNDYSQFLNNSLNVIQRFNLTALAIQDEYDDVEAGAASLQNLLNGISANKLTQELELLDNRRDNALNGVITLISGFNYSTDAVTKANANTLLVHLNAFGSSIARESYQNETNKIDNIVKDWSSKPELTAALTALGLDSWKTELSAANIAFDTFYVDRSVDKGLSTQDRVKEKRAQTNQLYYALRDALDAQYTINKKKQPEPFLSAINALNGLIKDYNDLMARRGYTADEAPATEGTTSTDTHNSKAA